MARNMITGIETQKMQEYTQEQIDRAEHMGIAIPADVKEQIFEYANLVGEEEKVMSNGANLAPHEISMLFAVLPETNCQGLFNQIHKKGARSTVWLLTPRLTAYIFPSSRSLQRYA